MPDAFGFNHLPQWGAVSHRCIDCDWPGFGVAVSEGERRKHQAQHKRDRQQSTERERRANLSKARRLKQQAERENAAAYGVRA